MPESAGRAGEGLRSIGWLARVCIFIYQSVYREQTAFPDTSELVMKTIYHAKLVITPSVPVGERRN